MKHNGWFFDVYPVRNGMMVWILDEAGRMHSCFDAFQPAFYLKLKKEQEHAVQQFLHKSHFPATVSSANKTELFSGEEWRMTSISVHNPLQFNRSVQLLQKHLPHYAFYNSNIPVAQMYLYDRKVFPLAKCEFTVSENGTLQHILLEDTFDAYDYHVPDLRIMSIKNGSGDFAVKYARTLTLEIGYENKTHTIEPNNPVEVLEAFNWHLKHYDPHVIISSWGDASFFVSLVQLSKKHNIPLLLNRDLSQEYFTTKERSYWTYGQVIHRDGAFMLAGRWHLDAENSFIMEESDIEGVIELARLTQLPMQKQSRSAIGTGLASMQMSYAYRNNILIPAEKKEGEDFKTADELLLSDRGGLVFMPELGYHEQIAELDFASMYPTLMEIHNISPETINCACCNNHIVPELHYTICEKRKGIVPSVLKPVLEKRAYYKLKKKNAATQREYKKYDRMQNALKWMLVTCFGYLGYKNARFGRIEAHESVNAFSREALLQAKELAEENNFHLVHAIIDCLWLYKHGATENDYLSLAQKIKDVVGVNISLEGIYNWILFPSSKTDPGIPTSGKYVGYYHHGEMKVRGIEVRRKDTPLYIKKMQAHLLELLSDVEQTSEIERRIPYILNEARFYLDELRGGRVNPRELVLRRRVQKEANEYANNNLSAVVVRELLQFAITVKAGEMIEYIIIDQSGKHSDQKAKSLLTYQLHDGYDIEKYTELLLKAVETLLSPFGYNLKHLQEYFSVGKPKRKTTEKRLPVPQFAF